MPDRRKRPLKRLNSGDARDRVISLQSIYRTEGFGVRRDAMAAAGHRALDEVAMPEPAEELEDSELSDRERRAAIERERFRRSR